jgi:hypothetical protein
MNKIELTNYQKSSIPSPKIGTVIFQTDGDVGYYEYTENGWVKLIQETMKKHEINLSELIEWQSEHKVLYASSGSENKYLYATIRGSFEVWKDGVRVLETMQPFRAVAKYNAL